MTDSNVTKELEKKLLSFITRRGSDAEHVAVDHRKVHGD